MIGRREWIKNMALSQLVGIFLLLLLLVNQGSTLSKFGIYGDARIIPLPTLMIDGEIMIFSTVMVM